MHRLLLWSTSPFHHGKIGKFFCTFSYFLSCQQKLGKQTKKILRSPTCEQRWVPNFIQLDKKQHRRGSWKFSHHKNVVTYYHNIFLTYNLMPQIPKARIILILKTSANVVKRGYSHWVDFLALTKCFLSLWQDSKMLYFLVSWLYLYCVSLGQWYSKLSKNQ